MLLKDFYKIISIEKAAAQKHRVTVEINKNHEVFIGHFPDNPIVPGVCMLQIMKELTEKVTNKSLVLQKLTSVKFLTLMNPNLNSLLILEFDILTTTDSIIKVKNTAIFNETIEIKMSGEYKIIAE